jgi:hypothetical protein
MCSLAVEGGFLEGFGSLFPFPFSAFEHTKCKGGGITLVVSLWCASRRPHPSRDLEPPLLLIMTKNHGKNLF